MYMTMEMTIVKAKILEVAVQTIKASVFKAKCLKLMDEVNQTGEEIVILKNGKPVSKLVPYKIKPRSLFGLHEGMIKAYDDLIDPTDVKWEAEQ